MYFLDYAANSPIHPTIKKEIIKCINNSNNYNNPHTSSNISSNNLIEEARNFFLDFYKLDSLKYTCVFTHGSTDACKLLSQNLTKEFPFYYTLDNHNSVLGIANTWPVSKCVSNIDDLPEDCYIAYPAESNFDGSRKFPMSIKNKKCYSIIDCSKYSTTTHDFSNTNADFLFFTFYKIFGFPQGLGLLFIKKSSLFLFDKKYFGGGTLDSIIPHTLNFKEKHFPDWLEDGTLSFLDIYIAMKCLPIYFSILNKKIDYLSTIYDYAINSLINKGYIIYKRSTSDYFSQIITFNHPTLGYKTIENICLSNNVIIRTGCFCNTGACSESLNLSSDDLLDFKNSGHTCSDNMDIINGKHTGACRISIGIETTLQEIKSLINGLPSINNCSSNFNSNSTIRLHKLFVYPVKSLDGLEITTTNLCSHGMELDRTHALFDKNDKLITAKQKPQITQLYPMFINDTLHLRDKVSGTTCDINSPSINSWIKSKLNIECYVKKMTNSNFSNTSQYLVINKKSMSELNTRILQKYLKFRFLSKFISFFYWIIDYSRFRPNIIIDCDPFLEDSIEYFQVGDIKFELDMPCTRCTATTVNSKTFSKDVSFEPLKTLSSFRNINGKINFGVLFNSISNGILNVSDSVKYYKVN